MLAVLCRQRLSPARRHHARVLPLVLVLWGYPRAEHRGGVSEPEHAGADRCASRGSRPSGELGRSGARSAAVADALGKTGGARAALWTLNVARRDRRRPRFLAAPKSRAFTPSWYHSIPRVFVFLERYLHPRPCETTSARASSHCSRDC